LDKKLEITDVENTENITTEIVKKCGEIRQQYLEEMACAYLKKTRIDPRNVVLVEEHSENGNIRWFYTEKSQIKLGDKQF